MRIAIGADHVGFELRERVKAHLLELSYRVIDLGTHGVQPVDYPDFAEAVGLTVLWQRCRCLCGGQQDSRHPCRPLPRPLLSTSGSRA